MYPPPQSITNASGLSVMTSHDPRYIFPRNVDVVEVESSNETASDLPGPGRLLGKVYELCGKRLEHAINIIAKHTGSGPRVVAERIIGRHQECLELGCYDKRDEKVQRQDCKKLIRYGK